MLEKRILLFTIIPLLLFAVLASFYRFWYLKDYNVTYEAECDPYTEECFYYCEEDSCDDIYYYKYITKHANDLYPLCGADITDCEAAATCDGGSVQCEVEYCYDDPDSCENLKEFDQPNLQLEMSSSNDTDI